MKYIEIYGNNITYLEICWKYFKLYGNIWKYKLFVSSGVSPSGESIFRIRICSK